jgi:hypothetical protein
MKPLPGVEWLALWAPRSEERRVIVMGRVAATLEEGAQRGLQALAGHGTVFEPLEEPIPTGPAELVGSIGLIDALFDGWSSTRAEARTQRMLVARFHVPVARIANLLAQQEAHMAWMAEAAARLTGASR